MNMLQTHKKDHFELIWKYKDLKEVCKKYTALIAEKLTQKDPKFKAFSFNNKKIYSHLKMTFYVHEKCESFSLLMIEICIFCLVLFWAYFGQTNKMPVTYYIF